jgi:hypothetical protein
MKITKKQAEELIKNGIGKEDHTLFITNNSRPGWPYGHVILGDGDIPEVTERQLKKMKIDYTQYQIR